MSGPENPTPRWAARLMRLIVLPDRVEEMLDDLEEQYQDRFDNGGSAKAAFAYWMDALSICGRPGFWRSFRPTSPSHLLAIQRTMIRYEVLVALRNMKKHLGHAGLNAAGLAIGLVCALFIGLDVEHEMSFDRHHENGDRIHRVVLEYVEVGRKWAPIGPPVGLALVESIPEIGRVARFFPSEGGVVLGEPERQVAVLKAGFADPAFLDMFTFTFVSGDAQTALDEIGEVAINASLAKELFGTTDAVGRDLPVSGFPDGVVGAVFEDQPVTTHLPVEAIFSMRTFYSGNEEWLARARTWAGFLTYVELQHADQAGVVAAKLPAFIDTFFEGIFEPPVSAGMKMELQPLTDIHLRSAREKEYVAGGDIRYVYTFVLVAVLVLGIAMVNFVNLTTARSATRSLEIGVRKSFGAIRWQILRQFLVESVLYAAVALFLTAGLAAVLSPFFESISGIQLSTRSLFSPRTVAFMGGIALVTGLISGVYPALVLARFRPIPSLRGEAGGREGRALLRKGLVTLQFALSIGLIASAAVVWSQLSYVRTKSLGFDKDHVLRIDLSSDAANAVTQNPDTFSEQLRALPEVVAVSQASDTPGSRYSVEGMQIEGTEDEIQMRVAWRADHDYPAALGLEFVAGRSFSRAAPQDSSAWVINESAARAFGLADPVGQVMRWDDYVGPIVGVVRDFNFASLRDEVEPLVIPLRPGFGGNLLVRFSGSDPAGLLDRVQSVMAELTPGEYLNYAFLDDEVRALYRREDTLRDVIGVFSALSLIVACLGLFGLASYAATRRSREIGIRKVLGASSRSILSLLSREFVLQLGIAFVLSVPVVLWAMRGWLQSFAYRIDLTPWYFVGAGLMAAVLALATVGTQALRAAQADPVQAIRHS